MSKIRTRFAPSPTGSLHIGGVRTALFNWLYSKHFGGEFILRIEDTDTERSTQASIDAIIQSMEWVGLMPSEEPIFQSDRTNRYKEVITELLDKKLAYYCYCSQEELEVVREEQRKAGIKPRYNRKCRNNNNPDNSTIPPVVRFCNPIEGEVIFNDLVRGTVTVKNDELDDLIIARSDGAPTYNFAVVIDDADMKISHVIRGDDHINNTPRQINIYNALGRSLPDFAHVPMIVGSDGQRLSKRHGAVSILDYRDQGYLPEAMINYLVRLGWSHGDQELFSLEEMVEFFSLKSINRSSAAFDINKLNWFNQNYIRESSDDVLEKILASALDKKGVIIEKGPALDLIVSAYKDRVQTMTELADKVLYLFEEVVMYDEAAAKKHLRPVATKLLSAAYDHLHKIDDWEVSDIGKALEQCVATNECKLGKLAQPLRVSVSGVAATPPIDVTLKLVGRERTMQRISSALDFIEERAKSIGA